ncbi:MAG: hypothetical protein M1497_01420 [Nitrospirae bacterium]|nr:hypothetical protein [Nitrospirota bacterium]
MNLSEIADSLVSLSKDNPVIAGIAGFVLIFLLIRKPKLFLGLFCLVLIVLAALYFIMDVSSIGKSGKAKMIEKGTHSEMDDLR